MNRLRPQALLAILLVAVPLAVLSAGLVSFLLLRGGAGFFVGMILPFLGSLVVVVVLGIVLGRAASGKRGTNETGKEDKSRRRNDV